jgi:hypothetical protein
MHVAEVSRWFTKKWVLSRDDARVKVGGTVSPVVSDPVGITPPVGRIVVVRTDLSRRSRIPFFDDTSDQHRDRSRMVGDTSIGDRCAEHRSGLNRLPSGVLENDGCQSASDGPGCLDAVVRFGWSNERHNCAALCGLCA